VRQHQLLVSALEEQLAAVKSESEEALTFSHSECKRLRAALAAGVLLLVLKLYEGFIKALLRLY
jgi:hypothetical protein